VESPRHPLSFPVKATAPFEKAQLNSLSLSTEPKTTTFLQSTTQSPFISGHGRVLNCLPNKSSLKTTYHFIVNYQLIANTKTKMSFD